ncbi:MAG: hypothetical protein GY780_07250 [bacterium]|nr:hypothetical protein [bacterium]
MGKKKMSASKGCGFLIAAMIAVPVLIIAVVGVRTWIPLIGAGNALEQLDQSLGLKTEYYPVPSGEIPADRMELFLKQRLVLVSACDDYSTVQKGFESVATLEKKDSGELQEVGSVALDLGSASLAITPFLGRFFKLRNETLLEAEMGLREYSYIFALAYHDLLLSKQTRQEIFSDGSALSPEASIMLKDCLARQLEVRSQMQGDRFDNEELEIELKKMTDDPGRLLWQDGPPAAIQASILPYREQLDQFFCKATAGLEMEQDARRALWIAIE